MGYLENLMDSSKNLQGNDIKYLIKVKRSEISSGSLETSLLEMIKLIVDLMRDEM